MVITQAGIAASESANQQISKVSDGVVSPFIPDPDPHDSTSFRRQLWHHAKALAGGEKPQQPIDRSGKEQEEEK